MYESKIKPKQVLNINEQPLRIKKMVARFRQTYDAKYTANTRQMIILAKHRKVGKGWGQTRNIFGKFKDTKND